MQLCRSAFLAKTTLFFFVAMLLFNPVYAQQVGPIHVGSTALSDQHKLPVIVVSEAEAQQLVGQFEGQGYVVREGTLAQLDELTTAAEQKAKDAEVSKEKAKEEQTKKEECAKQTRNKEDGAQAEGQAGDKPADPVDPKKQPDIQKSEDGKCVPKKVAGDVTQPQPQPQHSQDDDAVPVDMPELEPVLVPVPGPHPEPQVHATVGLNVNASGGGGGGNRDLAKVFFIFAGFVVVAAFVVYAGKYISEIVAGKDRKMWRELVFKSTFLSTEGGRHGQLMGARLATGFVSDELIQLALVGELGSTNLNLVLNENTDPTPLDISATYWMVGASARLHLTNKLVNASYLYLDFMGGTTSHKATDIIGAARFGASFGLDDHWRLGASLGAQYIGLDEGQGFNNDGENYWMTYGVEIGAQF